MKMGETYDFSDKEFIKGFTWCGKIPTLYEVNLFLFSESARRTNKIWVIKCPKYKKLYEVFCYDLTGKLSLDGRRIVNKYNFTDSSPMIILCRGIVDMCYSCDDCPKHLRHNRQLKLEYDEKSNTWIDETNYSKLESTEHVPAHRMAVFLTLNYAQKCAESVMRLGSKGSDTVRRMLANIVRGYVNIEDSYRNAVIEILEKRKDGTVKIDKQGRTAIEYKYQTNIAFRRNVWMKYFGSESSLMRFMKNRLVKPTETEVHNEVNEIDSKTIEEIREMTKRILHELQILKLRGGIKNEV